jgi:hypothetical protein
MALGGLPGPSVVWPLACRACPVSAHDDVVGSQPRRPNAWLQLALYYAAVRVREPPASFLC